MQIAPPDRLTAALADGFLYFVMPVMSGQPLRGTPELERILLKAARRVAEYSM